MVEYMFRYAQAKCMLKIGNLSHSMPFKRWFVGFSHWEFPMGFSHGTNSDWNLWNLNIFLLNIA
jgi:hypothetical protein